MENGRTVYSAEMKPDFKEIIKFSKELKGAEKKAEELIKYVNPKVYWMDFTLKVVGGNNVALGEDSLNIKSYYVAEGLKEGYTSATLAAATIGYALPHYSETCIKAGRLWEGTVADILGSLAVEAVIERFHRHVSEKRLNNGLYSSPRFSPGYGDWSLEGQADILSLLGTGSNITLGDGCILEPVKSVTALIGWSEEQKHDEYPTGNRGKGLCQGVGSCSSCRTWACMASRISGRVSH